MSNLSSNQTLLSFRQDQNGEWTVFLDNDFSYDNQRGINFPEKKEHLFKGHFAEIECEAPDQIYSMMFKNFDCINSLKQVVQFWDTLIPQIMKIRKQTLKKADKISDRNERKIMKSKAVHILLTEIKRTENSKSLGISFIEALPTKFTFTQQVFHEEELILD